MPDAVAGIRQWSEQAKAELQKALLQSAKIVEGESVKRCPMDTGELRRNHTSILDGMTAYVVYEHDVPPEQQYGLQVHECPGSQAALARNIAANRYRHGKPNRGHPWDVGEDHFLRNALDAKREEIKQHLENVMKEVCK